MEYEVILKYANLKVWTWDIINDTYSITINSDNTDSYNLNGDRFSIESWKKAIHPEDVDKAAENLEKVLIENYESYESMYRIQTKDGIYRWVHSKGKAVKDSQGNIIKITGCHTDITEKLDLEKKLFNIAYYDSLTKLPNKEKLFKDYNELLKSQSTNSQAGLAFLFMDIDNFGYINSILGYDKGNKIIKKFSNFLIERYPNDLVSRVSADEFIVIYSYKGDLSNIEKEAEALLRSIRDSNFVKGHDIKVSISVGISVFKEHGEEFYDLLKNADVALYCAKRNGKDGFKIYHNHMELKVFDYVDLINQIRIGLSKKEFQMFYHPIIDIKTGLMAGLEALIRWKHTQKGYIPPDKFIPIAEETGIMLMLEKWIIEEVFKQVKTWVGKGEMPIFVSINLSSKGLIESNLVEFLDEMLRKYKVNPQKIEFEVTETAMLDDVSHSIEILNQLVQKGFKISLDDFGTGYSSLNYLKSLPINNVKLDKSFIDCVVENKKDKFLVESIIGLSHSFDLKVIAEGVELEEQVDLLKDMGCDYIQGYYYGKPMNVTDTEDWIRKNYIEKYNFQTKTLEYRY